METTAEHKEMEKNHQIFLDGNMPCCGRERLCYLGPRGGLNINIKCAHCGAKWNVGPIEFERIG